MPFIGASTNSDNGFQTLMDKISRAATPAPSPTPVSSISTSASISSTSNSGANMGMSTLSNNEDTTNGDTTTETDKKRLPTAAQLPDASFELWKSSTVSTVSSVGSSMVCSSIFTDSDMKELMRFPNSSTHAYSYNPLSPFSLSVRLSILKRSVEIMLNNPSLLDDSDPSCTYVHMKEQQNNQMQLPVAPKMLRNASSAALSAFFTTKNQQKRPDLRKGSSSTNVLHTTWEIGSHDDSENSSEATSRRISLVSNLRSSISAQKLDSAAVASAAALVDFEEKKRNDLGQLLELLNKALENNKEDAASSLHKMSLFNINKLDIPSSPSHSTNDGEQPNSTSDTIIYDPHDLAIKKQLIESLAQPFHEAYNTREALMDERDLESKVEEYSKDPNALMAGNRILHTFTSQKNSSPKAIFTCSQQNPWKFRAANDLACLIFGISKNAMRALTLLDLIHSDSRNFVLDKLMSTEGQEQVFTGEIVGIKQPGHSSSSSGLIWSSIWAKRKNGLIVCVFEKVPCDYMDVLLNLDDYSVENIIGGEGLKYGIHGEPSKRTEQQADDSGKKSVKFENDLPDVKSISESLWTLINDVKSGKITGPDDDLLPMPLRIVNALNEVRYFTLNFSEFNIPCAVSCSILDTELKMKIHSLPYQTGVFILNLHSYEMLSFNKSISKNMFGLHYAELVDKSIATVIPSFPAMISYIREKYPEWDIYLPSNRGLVLTEHFFRKIDCEMKGRPEDFYDSNGLDAVHRDGRFIKVDIQLRVISRDYMVLWITYSRDLFAKEYSSNPSQLKILNESDINVVTGTSSEASSKTPTQKISVADFKEMHDSLEKLSLSLEGSTVGSHMDSKVAQAKVVADDSSEDSPNDVPKDDLELTAKLEVAKRFHKDKSLFVKDENFKLDKELIANITSSSPTLRPEGSGSESSLKQLSNSSAPYEIGSMKHKKKFSDFIVLQKMGEGAYGKVDLCMHKKDRYIVVIKRIYKERILVDTWVRDRVLGTIPSEIQIMVTLNKKPHDNILQIRDFFEDDDYYYLETEMHGETGSIDLFDLIELKTNMTEYEAKLLFKQIASGIKHLHDNGIVHRDIKDENVIVDNKGFVKLIDFGSAAYVKSGPFDVFVGTIDYAAPEVLGGEPYEGKPQDVWAIGVLLYTIIYKENPFYNIDEILDGDLRIQSTHEVSAGCVNLIKKILNRSVAKRPTINEIVEDPWLAL
ncbi:hypothetical protein C6P41_001133 [Kluyveromyces marxianus]|nr:hypothetical protein C6P43_003519 [Kluyveromyces marxianus]KAG0678182.1 hypothetical protein C6P41_001133 [Kluyveromyces marxianus]